MYLPDINFWLAAAFASHAHHDAASEWFQHVPMRECAFCRMTQQGFLRLATTPKVLTVKALTLIQAWRLYDDLFRDPRVVFSEEPGNLELLARVHTPPHIFAQGLE
jgi:toxin-antitoxin system PIN domain toxin